MIKLVLITSFWYFKTYVFRRIPNKFGAGTHHTEKITNQVNAA